jgi:site-specific DNA-methyltransferase (adenine-specific)
MKVVGNCEYGLIFYREKLPKFNNKGKMIFNCFDWERDDISSPLIRKIHPTQKPVKLLEKIIEIFTDEGDIIIDPCAGSGSSIVAGINKKRKAFGFEIKKDFYKEATEWIEEVRQANLDIEKFGFTKTLIEKQSLTLF